MSEEVRNGNTGSQVTNSTPEGEGGQAEKMFTQEEVNRIVQDRLAKERAKNEAPSAKEQELAAREARLACREYLLESGSPSVLLDVIDTANPEKFKEAVEKLRSAGFSLYSTGMSHNASGFGVPVRTGMSHQHNTDGANDPFADAFKTGR